MNISKIAILSLGLAGSIAAQAATKPCEELKAEIETKIKQKLGIGQPRGGAEVAPADDLAKRLARRPRVQHRIQLGQLIGGHRRAQNDAVARIAAQQARHQRPGLAPRIVQPGGVQTGRRGIQPVLPDHSCAASFSA